jgi:hypothetical protein
VPYDLAAIAAYNLKQYAAALQYGEKAVELSQNDERLVTNLVYYRAAAAS